MKRLFVLCSLVLLLLPLQSSAQIGWPKAYENAVVSSAEKLASEVGVDIIRQGGNAVDAAVAVQFALAVTYPVAGNIGGGGFMVIRLKDGTVDALDYREKAPSGATRDMYIRNGEADRRLSTFGALSVGVPGTVDGMMKALDRYGRLPLELVMAPAIKLAREGFPLSYSQAEDMNWSKTQFESFESSTLYFTTGDSTKYKEGDLFVQTDLANTLDRIARFGREGFYNGETARLIVDEMKKQGGLITLRDLRDYDSKWREPITTDFKGYTLHMMSPPSSGGIMIAQLLQMIAPYDLEYLGHNSAEYIHLLSEAMRRGYADRSYYLGDPDFWEVPQEELMTREYNEGRMSDFSTREATNSDDLNYGDFSEYIEPEQTTHFSIVDNEGNAVAVTTTLNAGFGSKLAVGGAGFLLNNEMDDFSSQPGVPNIYGLIGGDANAIEPGKRMLSSMTPTIVEKDGEVKMVLGAAGGSRIITTTLQTFLNLAFFDMNAQAAVAAPRFHHQWKPDYIRFEPGISKDTYNLLSRKNHTIRIAGPASRSHIIYVDSRGFLQGGYDPRGDGYVSGY